MPKIIQLKITAKPLAKRGGYFTFRVNTIKNTIVKNKILNMYFFIATTSFTECGTTAGVNTVKKSCLQTPENPTFFILSQ